MKLKFKHQKFQADAAKAVVDVFNGQPYQSGMSYILLQNRLKHYFQILGCQKYYCNCQNAIYLLL